MLTSSPSSPETKALLFLLLFVILGGFQWYLIASLVARWTCGFQKIMPVASKRFGVAIIVGLLLVVGCGIIPWSGYLERALYPRAKGPYTVPPVVLSGDSKDLRQSVVVPTLDTPMLQNRNVIWCGTLQLAWNHLGKDVLHASPQIQGAEAVVSRLNGTQFGENYLPPESYLAAAGFAKDGVVDRGKAEMKRRFQKDIEIDVIRPLILVAILVLIGFLLYKYVARL